MIGLVLVTHGHLATEFHTGQTAVAQLQPQLLFGKGGFSPHALGKCMGSHGAYPELFDPIRYSHSPVW